MVSRLNGNALLEDGREFEMNNCIRLVAFKKDYISNNFPLVSIQLEITEEMRNILRDNNFSFYLRISYYNISEETNTQELDVEETAEIGKTFDGIIRIYEKPFETTATKTESEKEGEETQINAMPYFTMTLSGIPEAAITENESTENNIYKNCELIDVIVNMLNGTEKTLHLQEPYNKEKYSDILIPPVALIPAINFLDTQYFGIYKNPSNIFIDTNDIYFYESYSNELYENIFEIKLLTSDSTDNLTNSKYIQKDTDSETMRLITRKLPDYSNKDTLQYHTLGSHTVRYYYDENFDIVKRTENNEKAYTKIRYLWEKLSVHDSEMFNKSAGMKFVIQNMNPEWITPLTKFTVNANDYKNVEGDYCICETSYVFNSIDFKHFSENQIISLIKI